MVDKDRLIRDLDRRVKIRALQAFEDHREPMAKFEQEFLRTALALLRRQPIMAALAGLPVSSLGASVDDVLASPETLPSAR